MRFSSLVLILAALFLTALISSAAWAEVSVNPLGFAVFYEDEPVENDLVLTNSGDEAVGFECKFRSVRRQNGRLGPWRDEPGDVIQEVQLDYYYTLGFSFDYENNIIYATHTLSARIAGYAWNGREITETVTDFATGANPVGCGYLDGVLYTSLWQTGSLLRYDTEGNAMDNLDLGLNGIMDITADPENQLLYVENFIAGGQPVSIYVYDAANNFQQVGVIQNIIIDNHADFRGRLDYAIAHEDGHLWCSLDTCAYQISIDENWNWEIIQQIDLTDVTDVRSFALTHDGENLWVSSISEADVNNHTAYIVDDGIVEQSWLTVEPLEGEIAAGEELVLHTSAEAGEREPGVYQMELRLRLSDPEQPEIRMSVIMSYETLTGDIHGQIIDPTIGEGEPVAGIKVDVEGYRMTRWTDEEGRFAFDWLPMEHYVLNITGEGYLPQTAEATLEQGNEQVDLALELEHSELALSIRDVFEALAPGDNTEVVFTGSNAGNGLLTYTTERHLAGGADVPPWTLRASHHLAAPLEDNYLQGVVYIDDEFYVAGQHNRVPAIYVLDRDGNLQRTFNQAGPDNRGYNDMTWDGHRIWGISGAVTVGITTEGEEVVRFNSPMALGKNIAWDEVNGCLWISGTTTDIFAMSPEGQQIRSFDALYNGEQLRMYGLDCYPDDPTGHTLYIFCKERDTDRTMLLKMNPNDGEILLVTYLDHEEGGSPMGICITSQYDIYSWVMAAVSNNTPDSGGDRVDVWQIDARRDWFLLNPDAGEIEAGGEQEFTVTLSAVNMAPAEYEGDVTFTHDGRGGRTLLPVHLSVREGRVPAQRTLQLPRGWNMVSVNLQPEPADDIRALTRALVDDDNLILMKDGAGHFYNPEFDFCNIPGWDVAQGYMVKVDRDGSLTLAGMTVMADEPIALADGWQMIAYYPRVAVDAIVALSGIVEQLILAKDYLGRFYNPEWGFSNMGNMMEGQGYQVKMDGDAELVYRVREGGLVENYELRITNYESRLPEHVNTGENMSLLVLAEGLDGVEVGVYAGEELVGSGVISQGCCGVAVWGDDATTTEVDGAQSGAQLSLRMDNADNMDAVDVVQGELNYETDGFAVVRLDASLVPLEFGLTGIYPNPFNSAVRLEYSLAEAGRVVLCIYDLNGRLIDVIVHSEKSIGVHSVHWDASALPSGLYFARLESQGRTAVMKLTLMK